MKHFTLTGTIQPQTLFKGRSESFQIDNFEVTLTDGRIEVSYDAPETETGAREAAKSLVEAMSTREGQPYKLALEGISEEYINASLSFAPEGSEPVHKVTKQIRLRYVVAKPPDANLITESLGLMKKCKSDRNLAEAVEYYNEALGDDNSLYAIHKAVEALTHAMGGQEQLAKLVGEPKKYVNDITQTAQLKRHSFSANRGAQKLLSEEECVKRTNKLILAYANKIK